MSVGGEGIVRDSEGGRARVFGFAEAAAGGGDKAEGVGEECGKEVGEHAGGHRPAVEEDEGESGRGRGIVVGVVEVAGVEGGDEDGHCGVLLGNDVGELVSYGDFGDWNEDTRCGESKWHLTWLYTYPRLGAWCI